MHYNYSLRMKIIIKLSVRLLKELSPYLRRHKQAVFCAPVIMGNNTVRMQMLHNKLHIGKTVFTDHIYQLMHCLRLQQKVHQSVLKGHQHVKLLKNSGSHYYHGKIFILINLTFCFQSFLPAFGAFSCQIRNLHILLPFRHILYHLILLCNIGNCRRSILRKKDQGSPLVIGICSPDTVSAYQLKAGISGDSPEHGKGITETFRFSVFFQCFQQILFWCQHKSHLPSACYPLSIRKIESLKYRFFMGLARCSLSSPVISFIFRSL